MGWVRSSSKYMLVRLWIFKFTLSHVYHSVHLQIKWNSCWMSNNEWFHQLILHSVHNEKSWSHAILIRIKSGSLEMQALDNGWGEIYSQCLSYKLHARQLPTTSPFVVMDQSTNCCPIVLFQSLLGVCVSMSLQTVLGCNNKCQHLK